MARVSGVRAPFERCALARLAARRASELELAVRAPAPTKLGSLDAALPDWVEGAGVCCCGSGSVPIVSFVVVLFVGKPAYDRLFVVRAQRRGGVGG